MQVTMVPRQHVDEIWSQVSGYLEGAAEYTYGRYSVEDIYDAIMDYDHTLWISFNEQGIKGAVVTNFIHYPKKKYLCMTFCGGVQLNQWKDPIIKLLQQWAKDNHCDGLEATARLGWTKIFKDDGHKPLWQTFQLPAADVGLGAQNG
jgi:hypothetical protein